MNESIYRSPKWLRKFFDYELTTGDDNVARRKEREEEAARIKKIQDDKEKREREQIERLRKEEKRIQDKKKEEEERKKRISSDLNKLYILIENDFKKSPFYDKFSTPSVDGNTTFQYIFENGNKINITKYNLLSKLVHTNNVDGEIITYTLSLVYSNYFITLANEIINSPLLRHRPRGSSKPDTKEEPKYKNPKEATFNSIRDTIKLREEQLKNYTGSDRANLESDLNNAKRKLKDMKDKYKFEMVSFSNFKN